MKLSIAAGGDKALQSAFVVLRGLENSIQKASKFGYEGIELSLIDPREIEKSTLLALLRKYGIEVSAVSTSQVFLEQNVSLLDEDADIRKRLEEIFKGFTDIAADFGRRISIGRIRGNTAGRPLSLCDDLFLDMVGRICAYAEPKGVDLMLEPINRYETDYINNCDEAAAIIKKAGVTNLKMLPDLFHMNIEEADMHTSFIKHASIVGYVHLADSNRCYPGCGHIDFIGVLNTLRDINYEGWAAVEILAKPEPDIAAREAASYMKKII